LGWGLFSVVAAQLVSVVFVSLFAIFFYVRNFYHLHFDLACSLSKSWWYIKRGLPFVPRVLFGWILAVGDRWILAKYGTLADVGMYTAADMFGKLFQVVFIVPFTLAYIPYMMEKLAASHEKVIAIDKQNLKNMLLVMTSLTILVILIFKPLLFLFKPIIFIILPAKYHDALNYVLGLLIGYIFLLGSYFASIFIQFQKRVYFTLFALLVPAVFNVFLNIFLVPKFGISGCVFATLISYILYFLINIFYNFYIKKT
jgi:Polysaccharide biosynthesis protein.